jgi:5-formyltetrahydrofolate cyclo-ligase
MPEADPKPRRDGPPGPDPAALARQKSLARRGARHARADAHRRLREHAPGMVAEAFLAGLPMPMLGVVSGYMPIDDELDPLPLMGQLAARGLTCALPVVVGRDRPLLFREWTPGMAMQPGRFGIPAPGPQALEVQPSVLLVPLLAFDRAGRRLGYGGGFYDRTLAGLRADAAVVAVGLAYAAQEIPAVPADARDQRLDWIVTEREVLSFAPLGGFEAEPGAARGAPGDDWPDDLLKD